MADPTLFTTVADNTLLPFGDGEVHTVGDDRISGPYDMTGIFEDGFLLGDRVIEDLYVGTNGGVRFANGSSFFSPGFSNDFTIVPLDRDLITGRDFPAEGQGIFIDMNEERDSIVVTWNEVGYFYQPGAGRATFQMEILDLGDGDAEVVFRYNDLNFDTYYNGFGITAGTDPRIYVSSAQAGSLDALDTAPGNTGVAGVWQFRVIDGDLQPLTDLIGNEITGDATDETLAGTGFPDILDGAGGNDTIDGGASSDSLTGGAGDDSILGQSGNDTLDGGDGDDDLRGQTGNDSLSGGAGNDTLGGAQGNDSLDGGDGDDSLSGGANQDTILGGAGDDSIGGGDGNDRIFAGMGDDTVTGDAVGSDVYEFGRDFLMGMGGDDVISGGRGNDTLAGQEGDDILSGGSGDDLLFGGTGDDFIFGGFDGADRAWGGEGADKFFSTGVRGGVTQVMDYDAGEGDVLVVDGEFFDASDFELRGVTVVQPDVPGLTFRPTDLVRLTDSGEAISLFTFGADFTGDRIVLRLPFEDEGETVTFDLM
ncbi:nidogen-like domain-containing protein [Jannaschia sp. 2305UL9-9]|uniref:nidogen-like domain-containing protein n=1 Tax=Jannaschia sp. 2305UL9-9 TaxID=3121638 RepID=UPI00352759F3